MMWNFREIGTNRTIGDKPPVYADEYEIAAARPVVLRTASFGLVAALAVTLSAPLSVSDSAGTTAQYQVAPEAAPAPMYPGLDETTSGQLRRVLNDFAEDLEILKNS